MSPNPDVPYRLEFSVEVPGTPDQVWDAIATATGMSAWFLPTDLDEHEGGSLHFAMGPDMGSDGRVTGWDPPRRLEYEEDWAALMGKDPAELSPLTSEFLVEARSGGTCVVRVTTSGFGVGADWEQEWWDTLGPGWLPSFDTLRAYLRHFAGQAATRMDVSASFPADEAALWTVVRDELGLTGAGAVVAANGASGTVEHVAERHAVVLLDAPVPGLLSVGVWPGEDGDALAIVRASWFSDDAPEHGRRAEPAWQAWLDALPVGSARLDR